MRWRVNLVVWPSSSLLCFPSAWRRPASRLPSRSSAAWSSAAGLHFCTSNFSFHTTRLPLTPTASFCFSFRTSNTFFPGRVKHPGSWNGFTGPGTGREGNNAEIITLWLHSDDVHLCWMWLLTLMLQVQNGSISLLKSVRTHLYDVFLCTYSEMISDGNDENAV